MSTETKTERLGQLPDDEVMARIQKLLNLAAKNSSEGEAAAAAAKAQELLTRYNLDVATVEQHGSRDGRRETAQVEGGFYKYQRSLWKAVAELNFCLHWVQEYEEWSNAKRVGTGSLRYTSQGYVTKRRHAVVGRVVNARATIAMATHLQQAIERVTLERLGEQVNKGYTYTGNPHQLKFSRWAVSFRKGAARRVVEQVEDRRRALEKIEARRAREAQARAERAGISTATTLTIADVARVEREANVDHAFGEGTSARWAAERAQKAREEREADEAYTRWAAEHPEEAAVEAEKRRSAARKRSERGGRGSGEDIDSGAYWSGYDQAADISLDQQVGGAPANAKRIGR